MSSRRTFLQRASLLLPASLALPSLASAAAAASTPAAAASPRRIPAQELAADVVIIGGGTGGCAAALAAARHGRRVIMTEETDWIGGQLTSQAVPPDENPLIETVGGTRSYLTFRQKVRDYYARNFPLTDAARANKLLNPGNGSVSKLCHEPRVALAVLEEMLAPYVAGQRVRILLRHVPTAATTNGDRVEAVQVRNLETGNTLVLRAPVFVDATELGDLLPLTRTEYVTGAEAQRDTGEPRAKPEAQPLNHQSFTCCFAMDYLAGEDHTIERPREYAFWRDHVPPLHPPWSGKLLSLFYSQPKTLKPFNMGFDPAKGTGLFKYRRIIDRTNFAPGTYAGDITLVNWPQNDYMLGNLVDVSAEEFARHVDRAKQLSLSWLYWLQTECPRPDGGTGWKGLRLRPDIVGTEDGLAKYPYIRESRRIKAELTITEQHVGTEARMKVTGKAANEVTAADFADSVGIGRYNIDLHPSSGGDNYIDFAALPFQIPLGSLLPQRMENLLPASKNIGTTHLTNGCYRLHPVEWNIGESVGELAAFCAAKQQPPRAVRKNATLLADFQRQLVASGIPLAWPKG
ncbi:MAG: FAD-dependent oxidoreductase [Opitutaceae bacterium]|nr:FAD-dependent oxidoreductase [Opitutaceae bacterium]